jgi:hypothetical protein
MSFKEYLHEKAEESRHNESVAYLMFLAGVVFFVGGILETLSLAKIILLGEPEWFFFIPYYTEAHPGSVVGLAMIISGLSLIVFGVVSGIHYSKDRSWYIQELRKAHSLDEVMMQSKSAKNASKKKNLKA